jgi:hypothetical protein
MGKPPLGGPDPAPGAAAVSLFDRIALTTALGVLGLGAPILLGMATPLPMGWWLAIAATWASTSSIMLAAVLIASLWVPKPPEPPHAE